MDVKQCDCLKNACVTLNRNPTRLEQQTATLETLSLGPNCRTALTEPKKYN
jgi:hypothetical protein